MRNASDRFVDIFYKCPKWLVVIFSWAIMIGLIFGFLWLNDNYLHIPINGDSDCSGRFESSCGSTDEVGHSYD